MLRNENEKLKNQASGLGLDYMGFVKWFLKTKSFIELVNQKAAPSYVMGLINFGNFIGVGNVYDPEVHNYA